MRLLLCPLLALVLLGCPDNDPRCEDLQLPQFDMNVDTSADPVVYSWDGSAISSLEVGLEQNDGAVLWFWRLECPYRTMTEDGRDLTELIDPATSFMVPREVCIQSPVIHDQTPEGVTDFVGTRPLQAGTEYVLQAGRWSWNPDGACYQVASHSSTFIQP